MSRLRPLALAALMLLAAAAPAQAADPASVYAKVASGTPYASLSAVQRKALLDYLTPVKYTTTKIAAPASSALAAVSCIGPVGHAVGARNAVGVLLWSYELYGEWCYDGLVIRSHDSYIKAHIYVLLWNFTNVSQAESVSVFSIPQRFNAYAQGQFQLCVIVACVESLLPWNRLHGYADGTYGFTGGVQ